MRRRKIEDLEFDNVPFVLNCVDVLAGDESFVGCGESGRCTAGSTRSRARVKEFDKVLADKTKQAEEHGERRAATRPSKAFQKQVDAVQSHTDWDERTKEIQLANIQTVAQRRLDVTKQIIEDKKLNEIREAKAESERQIRGIRNAVRFAAAIVPPLPPLILGLIVWIRRRTLENVGANPKRLVYDRGRSGRRQGLDWLTRVARAERMAFAERVQLAQASLASAAMQNNRLSSRQQGTAMNDLLKTTIFVGVAAGAHRLGILQHARPPAERTRPTSTTRGSRSSRTSRTRWPAPIWKSSTSMPSTATASRFRVMFKDKKWVIPSHYNYPADAQGPALEDGGGDHGPDQGHDPLEHRKNRRRWG